MTNSLKRLLLICIGVFSSTLSFCNAGDTVSLRSLCPNSRYQFGGTCFAYAPIYTAMSIMGRIDTTIKDKSIIFSDSYVYSSITKSYPWSKRIRSRCGKWGTYLKTLDFLKLKGTCLEGDFKTKCVKCGKKINKVAPRYKIKEYDVFPNAYRYIIQNNGAKEPFTAEEWVVRKLQKSKPVIVALQQVESFRTLKSGSWNPVYNDFNLVQNRAFANHVVCIIGYQKTADGLFFEVKNNYQNWGNGGFAFVKAKDFLLFCQDLATIEGIKTK